MGDAVSHRIGRPTDNAQTGIIDHPDCRLIGLHLYDGLFKVISFDYKGQLKEAFNIRLEVLQVLDSKFLYGCPKPTIVVLYQDNKDARHVKTFEVALKDKGFIEGPWSQNNLDNGADLLIPVPPLCGVLIIGEETIVYGSASAFKAIPIRPPMLDVPIYGRIATLELFGPHGETQDLLFIATERYKFCVLQWDPEAAEVITRAMGDVSDRIGRPTDNGQIGIIDPDCRLIGLHLYDGLFKVIPFDNKGQLKESFNIRFEELQALDIKFLYGCPKTTIVVLYQDKDARHVKTYEVALKDKGFIEGPWSQNNLDNGADLLIPVPPPLCGVLIIGEETIVYFSASAFKAIPIRPAITRSYGRVDADGSRYLLGDHNGLLHLLVITHEKEKVTGLKIELLGETSIASTISYLDNAFVYVGSSYGDSQGSHGKETPKTVKQITRLFPDEVLIQMPQPCKGILRFGHSGTRKSMFEYGNMFGSSLARSFHAQAFSHFSGPNHSAHGTNEDENARVIYVKFLPLFITKDFIRQHFEKFGTIKDVPRIGEIRTPGNKGEYSYAFIEYLEKISADNAIQASGMRVGRHKVKIERRTSIRYSKGAVKPTFSDKLEVYNEYVFSLPKHQTDQAFLHGKWACNIVNGNIVSLKGNHQNVGKKFKDEIQHFIKKNFPKGTAKDMLWKPPAGNLLKFWTHEILVHNVYKGRIYQADFFEECVRVCKPFFEDGEKSIPAVIKKYKKQLEYEQKSGGNSFNVKEEAVKVFQDVAVSTYGVQVRITQRTHFIDIALLQNSRKEFVDHVRPQPYGYNLKEFHTFF